MYYNTRYKKQVGADNITRSDQNAVGTSTLEILEQMVTLMRRWYKKI